MDNLTLKFLPSATEGNALLSPSGEYVGAYFTLIGGGSDADQNALGGLITQAVNERSQIRDFLGKVQGVCMGIAMSGRNHPNPDGALMELFNEAQAILFPPATPAAKGADHG